MIQVTKDLLVAVHDSQQLLLDLIEALSDVELQQRIADAWEAVDATSQNMKWNKEN